MVAGGTGGSGEGGGEATEDEVEILYRGRWKGRERPRKGKRLLGAGVKVQIDEQDLSAPPPVDACATRM